MSIRRRLALVGAMLLAGSSIAACGPDDYAFLDDHEGRGGQNDRERRHEEHSDDPDVRRIPPAAAAPAAQEAHRRRTEEHRPASTTPRGAALLGAQGGLRPLGDVPDPGKALPTADVRDRNGDVIGVVSAVQTLPAGGLEELIVALDDGKTLRVTPPFARYDDVTDSVMLVVAVDELR